MWYLQVRLGSRGHFCRYSTLGDLFLPSPPLPSPTATPARTAVFLLCAQVLLAHKQTANADFKSLDHLPVDQSRQGLSSDF